MRKQYRSVLGLVVAGLGLMATGTVRAGSLNPTNAPGPTMHTLEEIYQKQVDIDQKVGNLAPQTLQTLTSTTAVVNAGYYAATNLTQVDGDLAAGNIVKDIGIFGVTGTALIATGNATEAQVLEGSTFSKTGANGLIGTMTDRGAVAIMPGTTPQAIPQGYHNGSGSVSGDVNLVTGNIKAGTSIFGVAGKSSVVETVSGTAVASDMLASKTAYVNGALVTGDMVSRTLSSNTTVVSGGYYAATNLMQVEADLAAGNIVKDIGIFGVTGTALIATGNATAAQVLAGSTFSKTGANGLTGTMIDRGAVAITPGSTPQSIPQGYHNGSGSVSGDVNLVAGNIKTNVTIFGIAGTLSANGGIAYERVIRLSGALDFGNVATGASSVATLTIWNDGDCAMTVAGIQYSDSRFSGNCSGKVRAGGSTNVTVTFAPLLAQGYSGTITVNCDHTRGTNTIACTGTGTGSAVRYVDNGDGTVTDTATGLMWTKYANHGRMTWAEAVAYCDNLVANGYSDWRLPSVAQDGGTAELDTLGRANGNPSGTWEGFGAPFTGRQSDSYWSSSTHAGSTGGAWYVFLDFGLVYSVSKTVTLYVWPVRGGQ